MKIFINKIFYTIKPIIPRRLQILLRRRLVKYQLAKYTNIWPINSEANSKPKNWVGWPHGKRFSLVLTHDVDTEKGHKNCIQLLKLEKELGFCSSVNFVPLRYKLSSDLMNYLKTNGFEIGVHGLKHDGKLYHSKNIFQKRAKSINQFLKKWGAVGFRSPAMHHNLDWIFDLNIKYDASTFDTDPFEPQAAGVQTIFPFYISNAANGSGYVELPYTLPQDFTLFILMKQKNIDIWKKKLDWIVEHGGMALLNTHPDYMNISGEKKGFEEYPIQLYFQFLEYVKSTYEGNYWHALPMQVANYFYDNCI